MRNISARRPLLAVLALGSLLALLALVPAHSALATSNQVSIFYEDELGSNPVGVLQEIRHLGANMVRFNVNWDHIAPNPTSPQKPNFNATDPGAYPSANWGPVDAVVRAAHADGISVLLTVTGHAPKWAFGPGEPSDPGGLLGAWKPSVSDYGQFVKAVGTRYSGHYQGLPAVRTWEVFNEPNFAQDLSPQSVGSVLTGADMYRQLLAAGWSSLQASGHGHDTILFGELSAHGQNSPGAFGEAKPLQFVRELYCLDSRYHEFRGTAATQRGCPATSSAARGFRRQNPALFNASGFSIHPYPLGVDLAVPPNHTRYNDKDYATFVQLPNLETALDKSVHAWGAGKKYQLWNTEYGYITNPPTAGGVSLANQAYYLNWAEYLSWKSSRIRSFMQFLLIDPGLPSHFASGLLMQNQAPKPGLDAWRLPLYMPSTSTRKGRSLEVWGCVRPAPYAFRDSGRTQQGLIQFAPSGSSTFSTVQTVSVRSGSCYFDRQIKFPSSGTVRLAYSYPTDPMLTPTFALSYHDPLLPAASRSITITIR